MTLKYIVYVKHSALVYIKHSALALCFLVLPVLPSVIHHKQVTTLVKTHIQRKRAKMLLNLLFIQLFRYFTKKQDTD